MKKKTEHFILLATLAVGFLLRFVASAIHSYSPDELSAITRLKFNTFSELIELGVKTGDMHPSGVQIFMKLWSLVFGTSEIMMRLPFVLLGTGSIYLIYVIARRYSTQTGLFSAAFWSILLFPIIQSELARPYSPGLFFALLTTCFILKFNFDKLTGRDRILTALYLSLSLSACMYTHYFAFLMLGFISLLNLFFVQKKVRLYYIIAGIGAILLFLPHLSITMYQTSIDGGIQWLAPPDKFWLAKFIYHAFNNSLTLILSILVTLLLSIIANVKLRLSKPSQLTIMLLVWFFGTYFIGVTISYSFTPVMKYPVMLFPLPFLIIIISHLLSPLFTKTTIFIPVTLLVITLTSTIFEKKLLSNVHFEVLEELSLHIRSWEQDLGNDNFTIVMNLSDPNYLNFYGRQTGSPHQIDLDVLNYGDAEILDSLLQTSKESHLVLGYSGRHTPVQFLNQSTNYFPVIVDYHQYNNSAVFLLSKNQQNSFTKFEEVNSVSFQKSREKWKYEPGNLNSQTYFYKSDSLNNYGPEFKFPVDKKLVKNKHFIIVEVLANILSENQVTIVAVPERTNGDPIFDSHGKPVWLGLDIEKSLLENGKGSFAFSVPPNMSSNDHIKIYIWNRNKKTFLIKNVKIASVKNIWNN